MVRIAEALAAIVALVLFAWLWSPRIRGARTLRSSMLAWAVGSSVFLAFGMLSWRYVVDPRLSLSLVLVALVAGGACGAFGAVVHWYGRERDHAA